MSSSISFNWRAYNSARQKELNKAKLKDKFYEDYKQLLAMVGQHSLLKFNTLVAVNSDSEEMCAKISYYF